MKKFRKTIVALLAMAMVIGTLTITANAAPQSIKLHIKVADAATYGCNAWSDVKVTGGSNVNTWQNDDLSWQTHPSLIDEGDGWGYVTIDDVSKIKGVQIVKEKNPLKVGESDNIWNAEIASQGLTEAYFDSTTQKWYKEKSCTTEILPPVLDDIFYVVGQEALVGADWAPTDAKGLMTETATDVFTKTFTNIPAGTYEFKVLQDPADFGWDRVVWDDTYTPANKNMTITATETSDITFTVTVGGNGNALNVTVTPVQAQGGNTPAPTTAAPTTGANNTTTAANNTTTAEPTSANNGGQGGNNVNDNTTGRTVAVVIAGVAVMLAATVAFVASKKRVTE